MLPKMPRYQLYNRQTSQQSQVNFAGRGNPFGGIFRSASFSQPCRYIWFNFNASPPARQLNPLAVKHRHISKPTIFKTLQDDSFAASHFWHFIEAKIISFRLTPTAAIISPSTTQQATALEVPDRFNTCFPKVFALRRPAYLQ